MKRIIAVLSLVVFVFGSWAAYQAVSAPSDPPMSRLMPQGALVYLEAKDLAGLLQEWNASPEKQTWLKSDNYEVFSRSRLWGRLEQAQSEFAAAAGAPPDYQFLSQVAGQHSAVAVYDIGKLELLYISRVPSGKSIENALWQNRAKFEPRQADRKTFYVRTEPESGRVVAFAVEGDYLILGTREDLVAGALSLMSGKQAATLHGERWFAEAWKVGQEQGDLRLVVHLADVTKTPQFRTYWVEQNITDLRQYESSISDLYRTATEYKEERSLLRRTAPDQNASAVAADDARQVADLQRLAPQEIGFYKASAAPSVEETLKMLETKILAPRIGPAPPDTLAPSLTLTEGSVGNASELETRIDIPPPTPKELGRGDEALKNLLTKANIRAVLELHRSEASTDGVFIKLNSTIVLAAASDWNEATSPDVIQNLLAQGLTAGQLGAAWSRSGNGQQAHSALNGLHPVLLAIRGKYLVLSNDAETLSNVLSRFSEKASAQPADYVAVFDHQRERQNFYRLTSLVDQPARMRTNSGDSEPLFFSQNIASLSKGFEGLKSESIVVRSSGTMEKQTVRYEWSR